MPADWEAVKLPHSWNAVDGQDGGNDYFRGSCCYVKSFKKSGLPEAACYYLEIKGANSSADVTLNGKHLAHHDGGYSTWRVELTGELQEENLLAITVDNAANDKVYPQVADFTFYGGLYRDVNLIAVPKSHFDLDFFGSPGIKVTPVMEGDHAKVEVEVFVSNAREGQQVKLTVCDREGKEVFSAVGTEHKHSFVIENAHKWHGRKDPYLYCCEAELIEDGKATVKQSH
mgnify:CR=1 FL=1